MKIVLAPNAFKESLTAREAARAMRRGFRRALPQAELVELPVADGGDGVAEVLRASLGGRLSRHSVTGPLGHPVQAPLLRIHGEGPKTFVLEMAQTSGLHLVPPRQRNPMKTTTLGLGELIGVAVRRGAQRIVIGLGGSATVDGGAGMAQALGYRLLDRRGRSLSCGGGGLQNLDRIEAPESGEVAAGVEIVGLCDVSNPLLGDRGAARVFGPQKGASPAMIGRLESGLERLASLIERDLGRSVARLRGSGAAGGLGAGLAGVLGARLRPGADWILDAIRFDQAVRQADWVVTGEGRLDDQTLENKAPAVVAHRCRAMGIPVIALAGTVDGSLRRSRKGRALFASCRSIVNGPMSLTTAQADAVRLLEQAAYETGRLLSGRAA